MNNICQLCDCQGVPFLRATDVFERLSTEEFQYFRCPKCATIFLSPIPEDMKKHYGDYHGYRAPSLEELPVWAERHRWRLDYLQSLPLRGNRLLEVGPSFGAFAFLAREAGFSVDAIEMDERCCEYLRSFGVRATNSGVPEQAMASLGEYDAIVMWYSVEHVLRPWALLFESLKHLAPGGILVVAVPNPRSIQFRVFGKYWRHLDAPRHLHFIPPETMRSELTSRGVELLDLTTADAGTRFLNLGGWQQSMMIMARSGLTRQLARVAGRLAHHAFAPVEARTSTGATFIAAFRRGAS